MAESLAQIELDRVAARLRGLELPGDRLVGPFPVLQERSPSSAVMDFAVDLGERYQEADRAVGADLRGRGSGLPEMAWRWVAQWTNPHATPKTMATTTGITRTDLTSSSGEFRFTPRRS